MSPHLSPLGSSDARALWRLARRPDVVRAGTHLTTDGEAVWAAWIGSPDPERQMTVGARDGDGELTAALRLVPSTRRRMSHCAALELIASEAPDADPAIDALLEAALDGADRWYATSRIELRCAAGDARIEGLYARHGFALEVERRRGRLTEGQLVDEVQLARVRGPLGDFAAIPLPPLPPRSPRPDEGELSFRAVTADDGAWNARAMSEIGTLIGTGQLPFQRGERWTERFATNPPTHLFGLGAQLGEALVGLGVLILDTAVRRRHCAVLGMHVETAAQGRGIGAALLGRLVEESDRLRIDRLELTVFEDNHRARTLYERAGFELEGRAAFDVFRSGAYASSLVMARLR